MAGICIGDGLLMSRRNKGRDRPGLFLRVLISVVGAALVLLAVVRLSLFFFGDIAAADVNVRRVGGVNDGRPAKERYEWSLDYTFRDKAGKMYDGTTTRRGSDISVDTDGWVYYFSFSPYINALESDAEPNFTQLLLVIIGAFLVYIINRRNPRTYPDVRDGGGTA